MTPSKNNEQAKLENVWSNLVIAILSVNKYQLEKTWAIFEQLKTNGLFEPNNYAEWSYDEVFNKLLASQYNRGAMTGIFAERLLTISNLLNNIKANEHILAYGTKNDVSELLKQVKGVGPVVLDNFILLRDS